MNKNQILELAQKIHKSLGTVIKAHEQMVDFFETNKKHKQEVHEKLDTLNNAMLKLRQQLDKTL